MVDGVIGEYGQAAQSHVEEGIRHAVAPAPIRRHQITATLAVDQHRKLNSATLNDVQVTSVYTLHFIKFDFVAGGPGIKIANLCNNFVLLAIVLSLQFTCRYLYFLFIAR